MRHISTLVDLDARGHVTEKDLRDARGQFFTPRSVARPLIGQSLDALGPRSTIRVIDPFAGDGRLVEEVIRQVARRGGTERVEATLWEIHQEPLELARTRVLHALAEAGLEGTVTASVVDAFQHGCEHHGEFDLAITNPPWEGLKPDRRMLGRLPPSEQDAYIDDLRHADQAISSLYPEAVPERKFAGWGTNLSRVGLALCMRLVGPGVIGIVLPASFFADTSHPTLRKNLVERFAIKRIDSYQAEAKLFPGMDVPFATMVVTSRQSSDGMRFPLVRHKPGGGTSRTFVNQPTPGQEDWNLPLSVAALSQASGRRIKPLMTLEDQLASGGFWAGRELDETGLKSILAGDAEVPFAKGKDVQRYRFTFDGQSHVPLSMVTATPTYKKTRLVWRDVSRPSQTRRVQAAILPAGYVTGNSLGVLTSLEGNDDALNWFLGIMNSATFEAQLRTVLATGHVTLASLRKMRMPNRTDLGDVIASAAVDQASEYSEERQAILEGLVASAYGLTRRQLGSLLGSHAWLAPECHALCLRTFEEHK